MPKLLIFKYDGKPSKEVNPEVMHDQSTSVALIVSAGKIQMLFSDAEGFVHAKLMVSPSNALVIATELAGAAGTSQAMADLNAGAVSSKSESLH